ncbi:hypothetical protein CHH65_13465 [Shouchella clausii]|nr:hypothetical protein CHH65_13465 [Shouchella clausii]
MGYQNNGQTGGMNIAGQNSKGALKVARHLLVYDYDWWVLGAKAKMIQQHHPFLDICSLAELKGSVAEKGASAINSSYDVIAALGLGIAQTLSFIGIRVDSSQIGSYNYLTKNHQAYREWSDHFKANHDFFRRMMKAARYGAISPKLAYEVKKRLPHKTVSFIRPFVDSERFCPSPTKPADNKGKIVIGWVGNDKRKVKNYHTLYKALVRAFANDPNVVFIEATRSATVPLEKMPSFYNKLDLLLITSSNEGGPAPAMEAYASGVPVLSTNVGYVKTVAGPKCRSLIIDSLALQDFANKIRELQADKDYLIELKQEARAQMVAHFTVEKTIGDWLEVLFAIKPKPSKGEST